MLPSSKVSLRLKTVVEVHSVLSDAVDYILKQILMSHGLLLNKVDRWPVGGVYLEQQCRRIFSMALLSHYKLSAVCSICKRDFNDHFQADDSKASGSVDLNISVFANPLYLNTPWAPQLKLSPHARASFSLNESA